MAEGLPNNSTDLQPGNGTPGQHDNKRRPHRDSAESKEIADLARALLNDMLPIVMEPLEAKDNEELERTAAGLVEDMMPHVLAGIEKNETVKTGPEPKVEPKAETEVPLESYMKLAPATPYPPMQEKFRFEAVDVYLAADRHELVGRIESRCEA
ncbi:MAG: hypothetical protein NT003_03155 [Candidatus Magasanikbacteria bacterium]|nr:hypothetical protein [Candidatus Magasanikbacteria bacterium]